MLQDILIVVAIMCCLAIVVGIAIGLIRWMMRIAWCASQVVLKTDEQTTEIKGMRSDLRILDYRVTDLEAWREATESE